MGLISRRLRYWHWQFRYWLLDTKGGEVAQKWCCGFAAVVAVVQLIRMAVAGLAAPPAGEPVKAVYWWVVQLIILVVSAAISYSMRPKTETPKPQSGEAPTVEDGQSVKHHFGTVWVEDEFVLAWKVTGTQPIKSKGGKK